MSAVDVIGAHRLRMRFEDGAESELALSDWLWQGVFEPLQDSEFFAQVQLAEPADQARRPA